MHKIHFKLRKKNTTHLDRLCQLESLDIDVVSKIRRIENAPQVGSPYNNERARVLTEDDYDWLLQLAYNYYKTEQARIDRDYPKKSKND